MSFKVEAVLMYKKEKADDNQPMRSGLEREVKLFMLLQRCLVLDTPRGR